MRTSYYLELHNKPRVNMADMIMDARDSGSLPKASLCSFGILSGKASRYYMSDLLALRVNRKDILFFISHVKFWVHASKLLAQFSWRGKRLRYSLFCT